MLGLKFEWDPEKERINERKHGVGFDDAESVFWDEHALLIFDPEHSEHEDRFILLGMSASIRMLVVCHCYRMDNVVRIISARKSSKAEEAKYWSRR